MGDLQIMAFKAKPGKRARLEELARYNVPMLRRSGYVTSRPANMLWTENDTLIAVFEWVEGGKERAKAHPDVRALAMDLSEVGIRVPLNTLPKDRVEHAIGTEASFAS